MSQVVKGDAYGVPGGQGVGHGCPWGSGGRVGCQGGGSKVSILESIATFDGSFVI